MSAAAGWHPDPERPGFERFWDGHRWTDDRRRASSANVSSNFLGAPGLSGGELTIVARLEAVWAEQRRTNELLERIAQRLESGDQR